MNTAYTQSAVALVEALQRSRLSFEDVAEANGLTSPQMMVLYGLYKQDDIMSTLAKNMRCDASNITGIVDRLEAQRLIIRSTPAEDRRARQLIITGAGRNLIEKIILELPGALNLLVLTKNELKDLEKILAKL